MVPKKRSYEVYFKKQTNKPLSSIKCHTLTAIMMSSNCSLMKEIGWSCQKDCFFLCIYKMIILRIARKHIVKLLMQQFCHINDNLQVQPEQNHGSYKLGGERNYASMARPSWSETRNLTPDYHLEQLEAKLSSLSAAYKI